MRQFHAQPVEIQRKSKLRHYPKMVRFDYYAEKRQTRCMSNEHLPRRITPNAGAIEMARQQAMQAMSIKTRIDPKEFRVKFATIKVRDGGEFETTATTEIKDENYDAATAMFTMVIALHYPLRTSGIKISMATPARGATGTPIALEPDCHLLTQAEFEAVIRGVVIDVPACY